MKLLACILLVCAAASAGAQLPSEVPVLIETARRERADGHADLALRAAERAVALAPQSPEALSLAGSLHAEAGRTDQALELLATAARLAPKDDDIRLAIARVHYFRGEHARAAAITAEVLTRRPSDQDARDLLDRTRRAASAAGPERRWRLDLATSYSAFRDDERERWLEGSAALGYRIDRRTTATARVDVADRFGRTDAFVEVRGDRQATGGRFGYLALGITPRADFLPQWTVSAGGGFQAWDGGVGAGVVTLDARHSQFSTGSVETLSPGIEQHVLNGRVWITGRLIHTWDERNDEQTGFLGRVDATASDRARVFLGYADAPETVDNLTLTTRTLFAGAVVDLDDRFTLRLDYAHDDRERTYVRQAFAAGLGVRF